MANDSSWFEKLLVAKFPQYYFNETPQIKLYVVENHVR